MRLPQALWLAGALLLLVGWIGEAVLPGAAPRLGVLYACLGPGELIVDAQTGSVSAWTRRPDPWGRPCFGTWGADGRWTHSSAGPDGRHGSGDDVTISPRELALARTASNLPFAVALLLGAVGVAATSRLARRPRSPALGRELLRAAWFAAFPAVLVLLALTALLGGVADEVSAATSPVPSLLGPQATAFVAVVATCVGLAFAWRRGLPLEGEPAEVGPGGRASGP